jgi:glutamyl-tRNA synthetase
MNVKVRVAPSPTGNLHIGRVQAALVNWLFARRYDGQFFFRLEDTDQERSKKEFEQKIIDSLLWLGLQWDNERILRSTENAPAYRRHLEKLLESGKAFWCHHTMEELEAERQAQQQGKETPRHVCAHKTTDQGKQPGGIIRLAVDADSDRVIEFDDLIRGSIRFEARLLGDISIARNLDSALYHMAVTCDDIAMEITHVLRGEEHISNTPKQILIYEALGEEVPRFGHVPLLLAPDRSKLSARHGAPTVTELEKDYLPEAVINFIGALSYTYSREILSKEEMAQEFEIEKVHKSGAVVDFKKLNWINAQYVRKLSAEEFRKVVSMPELSDLAIPLITERLEKLSDVKNFSYLWQTPEYDAELLKWKDTEVHLIKLSLEKSRGVIENFDFENESKDILRVRLDAISGDNRGLIYWPLRVALTGAKTSPDPVDIVSVLGKIEVLKRIDLAISKIS